MRTLQRAADIVGGPEALAQKLRVTPSHLELWLKGLESPGEEIFLRAVDIVSDDETGTMKRTD
jgi:DNA-binding transcriptional regulator YdaS (Cro superfamily)